jgi:hypothetical protein
MNEGMDAQSVIAQTIETGGLYGQTINYEGAANPMLAACVTSNEQALSNIKEQEQYHCARQLAHEENENNELSAASEQDTIEGFNNRVDKAKREHKDAVAHNNEAHNLDGEAAKTLDNLDKAERNLGSGPKV